MACNRTLNSTGGEYEDNPKTNRKHRHSAIQSTYKLLHV